MQTQVLEKAMAVHHIMSQRSERYFAIEEGQLRVLKRLSRRLFTEQRMDGNEMRDTAQSLEAIVRVVQELEIP